MDAEEDRWQDVGADEPARRSSLSELWSAPVCAVSAFTLAVVALFGQNVVSVGMGSVFESVSGQPRDGFYLGWSLAVAVQVILVWLLARRGIEATERWAALLARAAIVLSCVALAAGALVALGGQLS